MLHFNASEASGHPSVWGMRVADPDADFEADLQKGLALHAPPLIGQRLGGIGFYRNATGQPRFNAAQGAYLFNTYKTTYVYAEGQYSLAVQVSIILNEILNLHDATALNTVIGITLTDGLTLHDAFSANKITFVALTEALTLHDALLLNTKFNIALSENLLLSDSILTNTPLLSYVVNANTNAVVKYHNFNFNSYANLNGKYYGIMDDGIYELDGDTDDGAAIAASVTLGKQDFSSEMLKQMQCVYIGTHSNGNLILKVMTDSGAVNYYTMTGQVSGDIQTNRVIIGKGLRSRYWQFELTNVSGGDLTFDSISFHPVEISRRIGGAL